MFVVTTERNKKKKRSNVPKKQPPSIPNKQPLELKQSHSDNRWANQAALNLNNNKNKKGVNGEAPPLFSDMALNNSKPVPMLHSASYDDKKEPPPPYCEQNNVSEGEGHAGTEEPVSANDQPKNLNLPAFNPAYQMQLQQAESQDDNKEDHNDNLKVNRASHKPKHSEIIEYYYDEGSSPAYLAKTIDMAEAKCYRNSHLCIWKIAEKASYDDDDESEQEDESQEFSTNSFIGGKDEDIKDEEEAKETLQILMGTRMNDDHSRMELCIFGGDRIIADHGPIDCSIRLFRDQTAQVLDETICGQIKQSLATDKDRVMYWSGDESKSVTYFYNMEYDYEMVESYNEFKGIEQLYFKKLYWINWQDVYQYSILYQADPEPIMIEKQKCYIHDNVCQLMLANDVESHFRVIMNPNDDDNKNDQFQNDKARDSEPEEEEEDNESNRDYQEIENENEHNDNEMMDNDEFDPYGLASAPKMSVASFAFNSGSAILNGDHDHLKKYRWQWDSMYYLH